MAPDQNPGDPTRTAKESSDGKQDGGEQFRGHYGDETGEGSRFLGQRGKAGSGEASQDKPDAAGTGIDTTDTTGKARDR